MLTWGYYVMSLPYLKGARLAESKTKFPFKQMKAKTCFLYFELNKCNGI